MSTREYATIVTESAMNTPTATPVLNTDYIVCRLDTPGSLGVRYDPARWTINDGKGMNLLSLTGSERGMPSGTFRTKLYREQVTLLLNWALKPMSGGTSPWTSSIPTGDLPTCSIYHAIVAEDSGATVKRKRYGGMTVQRLTLTADNQSDLWMAEFTLMGSTSSGLTLDSTSDPDGTEFPEPALSDYATNVYTFQDISSLKLSSSRTAAAMVQFSVDNTLDPRYNIARHPARFKYCGRRATLQARLTYETLTDRAAYEDLSAMDSELVVTDGTKQWKIDFFDKPVITQLSDELDYTKAFEQTMTIQSYLSVANGADIALTIT